MSGSRGKPGRACRVRVSRRAELDKPLIYRVQPLISAFICVAFPCSIRLSASLSPPTATQVLLATRPLRVAQAQPHTRLATSSASYSSLVWPPFTN